MSESPGPREHGPVIGVDSGTLPGWAVVVRIGAGTTPVPAGRQGLLA